MTFIIDTDAVQVVAQRLEAAADQANGTASRVANRLSLVEKESDVPPGLTALAGDLSFTATRLQAVVNDFLANELTRDDLASVDLGELLQARLRTEIEKEFRSALRDAILDTEPEIEVGADLRSHTYFERGAQGDDGPRVTDVYFIDENGRKQLVTAGDDGLSVVTKDGQRYPVVTGPDGNPIVLIKGRTSAEIVRNDLQQRIQQDDSTDVPEDREPSAIPDDGVLGRVLDELTDYTLGKVPDDPPFPGDVPPFPGRPGKRLPIGGVFSFVTNFDLDYFGIELTFDNVESFLDSTLPGLIDEAVEEASEAISTGINAVSEFFGAVFDFFFGEESIEDQRRDFDNDQARKDNLAAEGIDPSVRDDPKDTGPGGIL